MSPTNDESKLDEDEHTSFMMYVLNPYGKCWDNVYCLTGDNASLKNSVATKAALQIVGCVSHRFNLALQDFIELEKERVDEINLVVLKPKYLLLSTKLRKLTHLRPKLPNATRWSSA